jgi:hypothetical protein
LKELLRTNDPVRLSYLTAVLEDAGIPSVIFDAFTANVEGSLGMLPRRLMVADDDHAEAVEILRSIDAG